MTDNLSAQASGNPLAGATHAITSAHSFRRRQRLVTGTDFDRVFKKNHRSRDQHFIVLARHNNLPYARLGMAISRKAAGDAVPRNRLKRMVRESFRNTPENFPGVDCVVMARPGAAKQGGDILLKSLSKHWAQVTRACAASS